MQHIGWWLDNFIYYKTQTWTLTIGFTTIINIWKVALGARKILLTQHANDVVSVVHDGDIGFSADMGANTRLTNSSDHRYVEVEEEENRNEKKEYERKFMDRIPLE